MRGREEEEGEEKKEGIYCNPKLKVRARTLRGNFNARDLSFRYAFPLKKHGRCRDFQRVEVEEGRGKNLENSASRSRRQGPFRVATEAHSPAAGPTRGTTSERRVDALRSELWL